MERPLLPETIKLPDLKLLANRSRLLVLLCSAAGCTGYSTSLKGPQDLRTDETKVKIVSVEIPDITPPLVAEEEAAASTWVQEAPKNCPDDMVDVEGDYCIDRYEGSLVDKKEGRPLSPYFTPDPSVGRKQYRRWFYQAGKTGRRFDVLTPVPEPDEWQLNEDFDLVAVSEPGVLPNGYVTKAQAERACENAGKRLCTSDEWVTACRGQNDTLHPYGEKYREGRCNINRLFHPSLVLTGDAGTNHDDPRLNLLQYKGVPLLQVAGASAACVSRWDDNRSGDNIVYDMEGNLSEWVQSPERLEKLDVRIFRGGAYTHPGDKGCERVHGNHAVGYYGYDTGFRCCKDSNPKGDE